MPQYNEYVGTVDGTSKSASREHIVASGVTLTVGDFVYLSGGFLTNAAIAGKKLLGQVIAGDSVSLNRSSSRTVVGDGTRTALVNVEKTARFLVQSNEISATLASTDIGNYFDLTGATGLQRIVPTTTSATTGQMLYGTNARAIRGSNATFGIFTIAENQHDTV